MNFFTALFGILFTSIIILPVLMLAGAVTYHYWPILLFLIWTFVAFLRGRIF